MKDKYQPVALFFSAYDIEPEQLSGEQFARHDQLNIISTNVENDIAQATLLLQQNNIPYQIQEAKIAVMQLVTSSTIHGKSLSVLGFDHKNALALLESYFSKPTLYPGEYHVNKESMDTPEIVRESNEEENERHISKTSGGGSIWGGIVTILSIIFTIIEIIQCGN